MLVFTDSLKILLDQGKAGLQLPIVIQQFLEVIILNLGLRCLLCRLHKVGLANHALQTVRLLIVNTVRGTMPKLCGATFKFKGFRCFLVVSNLGGCLGHLLAGRAAPTLPQVRFKSMDCRLEVRGVALVGVH